jgi:hypothetical protein
MDWTKREVQLIVADYFSMLQKELSQVKYSKTEHRNALRPLLENRSDGSIEFKHQNISAVLLKMELPFIKGYKPMPNFQGILSEEVARYIRSHLFVLEKQFQQFADESAISKPYQSINFEKAVGEEPTQLELKEPTSTYRRRPIKINYLEKEQNNRLLGEGGEKFVFEYERWRLVTVGKAILAEEVKWVSKESGDGLGYDILSKNEDGSDKYIEVKTTKLSKESPFYVTRGELDFAAENFNNFFLYRVYNFATTPQFFVKQGKYEDFCKLQPVTFIGRF